MDEADRILDLGFSAQLKAVLSYLPQSLSSSASSSSSLASHRQTLLFSATQTKSVRALARLSMSKDAEYVSVHGLSNAQQQRGAKEKKEKNKKKGDGSGSDEDDDDDDDDDESEEEEEEETFVTPSQLEQHVMVLGEGEKLDAVFSFVKAHLKSKSIIFFSTCAQVRFVYETFRTLQPGVPLMAIHGQSVQSNHLVH